MKNWTRDGWDDTDKSGETVKEWRAERAIAEGEREDGNARGMFH